MKGREFKGNFLTYVLSLTAIGLWGASYIWSDSLIGRNIPIFYFVFVRISVAGILLFLFSAASRRLAGIRKKDLKWFLLLAFCEPFIYFLFETYGIKFTGSPTLSAMTVATIPIFSIFAGVILFRERICGVNILGIFLSLGGIVLVAMAKGSLGEHFIIGVAFLLVAVMAEVCHASITKKLSDHYSSLNIVMYQFLIGSVYLLPLFIFKGLEDFDAASYLCWDTWRPILCLSVLCSSLAFSLWVGTIKKLGVAKSSIFTALIPVASAVIAWLCGHELLNPRQWVGVAICAVGVVLSQVTVKTGGRKDA